MKLAKVIAAAMVMAVSSVQVHAGALQDILSSGTLKVGTTGDWNPMTMKDSATNSYTGFDIDVMTQLAADLGVELELVPTEWKTLVAGITAGKYHMTGSASVSPARAKATGYSDSYFSLATVPLTLKSNADKYKDWEDLNNADVRVAATLGTTQEKQVKQYFPDAKHVIVEAPAQPFQQVLSGRADAHITSNVEANKLVAIHSDLMIVPVSAPKSPTPIAMLLPQADQFPQAYPTCFNKRVFSNLSALTGVNEVKARITIKSLNKIMLFKTTLNFHGKFITNFLRIF